MKKRILSILLSAIMMISGIVFVSAAEVNLAQLQGVTGKFISTRGGYELPASGTQIPSNAWDGDLNTIACAGNEFAYIFEIDLGEAYNVGEVVMTFGAAPNFPTHYKISVSADGDTWRDVVKIEGNTNSDRRTHKFASTDTRYVRIADEKEYWGISQMTIAELEIYEGSGDEIVMTLMQPTDGEIGVESDSTVIIATGGKVPMSYLSGVKLMRSGEETDCYKELVDGVITLTPKNELKTGVYTVTIQGKDMWSFTVANENLTKTAKATYIHPAEVEITRNIAGSFSNPSNAIDGKIETVACAVHTYLKWSLQLDFGKAYESMNFAKILLDAENAGVGDIEITVSDDLRNWKQVAMVPVIKQKEINAWFPEVTARYMRLTIMSTNTPRIGFAEVEVLSVPTEDASKAEFVANGRANGEITINFSSGMDVDTLSSGITLKKGDASTPCGERVEAECEIVAENSRQIILKPKTGLDYGENYVVSVNDKAKSVWGIPAEPSFAEFTVEAVKPLEITTLSSSKYMEDKENSIYPAFVDNMSYQSWTYEGEKNYYDIKADGGKGPYKFTLVSGALPDGITMNEYGRLSGTPTKEGDFEFTVKVTDAAGNTAEKTLGMEANPYRSKWFDDARFGVMNQSMGAASYLNTYGIEEGMERYKEFVDDVFYPEKWAKQLSELGVKVFNFTALGGDGVRKWPSDVDSTYKLSLDRNCVTELLEACHKYDIKLVTYVAPDTSWTKISQELDDKTGTWFELTLAATKELAKMGVDGIWYDSGTNTSVANWKELFAVVRTENPYTMLNTNSGIYTGGRVAHYPYTDIENWEGYHAAYYPDDLRYPNDIYTAFKSNTRKKIALETTVLAGPHWGVENIESDFELEATMKPVDELIDSIQSNWDMGATFMMVYPFIPMPGGNLIHENSKDAINEITEWVKVNVVPSNTPVPSLEEGTYKGEQTLTLSGNGEIYYTTDGSIPDKNSTPYTEPIKITDSVRIRAVAFEEGKGKSIIMQKDYIIEGKTEDCVKLTEDEIKVNVQRPVVNTMSGMQVRVGKNPLKLRAIGRYATGDDGEGHLLTVKRWGGPTTEPPLMYSEIDMSIGDADAQGYKYKEIAPVILEPFKTYVILCEETSETTFANVADFNSINTNNANVLEGVITNDLYKIVAKDDIDGELTDKQQLLNLKFDVMPVPDSIDERNIASDAKVTLLDNNGNVMGPSGYIQYAVNAIDGDISTVAAPGYAYAWTLHVDLKKTYKGINEIIWTMGDGYATEYQIDISNDNVKWTTITRGKNNHSGGEKKFNYFIPFSARYIRLRSLKPDGPDQEGGQMQVAELVIHQTDKGFAQN